MYARPDDVFVGQDAILRAEWHSAFRCLCGAARHTGPRRERRVANPPRDAIPPHITKLFHFYVAHPQPLGVCRLSAIGK